MEGRAAVTTRRDPDPAEIEFTLGTRSDGLAGRHQPVSIFVGAKGRTKQQAGMVRLTAAEHKALRNLLEKREQ